ncbi:MAG: DUF805 domain-containing protein [Ruminococcus sp.]|nr:DUF805 domain-containing protein [Ruminococcus sp.]
MKCNYCGKEISDNAKFCNGCGAPVAQTNGTVNLSKPSENIDRNINNTPNVPYIAPNSTINTGESPKYVDFGEAISLFFKNYVNFSGRSTRSEYWFSVLFMFIIGFVLGIMGEKVEFISRLWTLATFLPSLAIACRRFHDAGKNITPLIILYVAEFVMGILAFAAFGSAIFGLSGSRSAATATGGLIIIFALAALATLGIAVYNIVILCQPSQPTDNKYGRPPMQ